MSLDPAGMSACATSPTQKMRTYFVRTLSIAGRADFAMEIARHQYTFNQLCNRVPVFARWADREISQHPKLTSIAKYGRPWLGLNGRAPK